VSGGDSRGDRGFEIVSIDHVARSEVLAVLNESLGPGHTEAWFRWKHLNNPFGASRGWAAMGADGVLGVRLFMRWQLRLGHRVIPSVRPVDTATAVRARGRGIFRRLTEFAVAAIAEADDTSLIFNTPNQNSRHGYARMGWSLLPPLAHGIWPAWPGRTADLEMDASVFAAFDDTGSAFDRLVTPRSAAVMHWRYGTFPGNTYRIARLRQAETPNGIVYGVTVRRGIRLLIVHELAGTAEERRRLVCSAARREGAVAVMAATGSGALNLVLGSCLRRGHSVLAVRALNGLPLDASRLQCWALTLGDLERIL
jgi:hypothetical protein